MISKQQIITFKLKDDKFSYFIQFFFVNYDKSFLWQNFLSNFLFIIYFLFFLYLDGYVIITKSMKSMIVREETIEVTVIKKQPTEATTTRVTLRAATKVRIK